MNEVTLWIIIALLTGMVLGLGSALWFIGTIIQAWLIGRGRGLHIE